MSGKRCPVARYWGREHRAWRCDLEKGHEGKHYDPERRMYWGDVLVLHGRSKP